MSLISPGVEFSELTSKCNTKSLAGNIPVIISSPLFIHLSVGFFCPSAQFWPLIAACWGSGRTHHEGDRRPVLERGHDPRLGARMARRRGARRASVLFQGDESLAWHALEL